MWSIIAFLAIGALAGWLAGKIMKSEGGLAFNIVLGVAGAFVGSWVGSFMGVYTGMLSFSLGSILSAVVGACLLIAIVRFFKR